MPTPIDKAMNSKNLFLGFAGLITAVSVWSIWGGDMFPQAADPKGEPETWSEEDMKRWLNSVRWVIDDVLLVTDMMAAQLDGRQHRNKGGAARQSEGKYACTKSVGSIKNDDLSRTRFDASAEPMIPCI
ncbi:hypothetical protein LTR22_013267 [Elasticomyces elasticus]|nr:hypothetical protein LTR22_013267 [Elasticomyces elasticus]